MLGVDSKDVVLRWATRDDAPFVARGVAMALHVVPNDEELRQITEVCRRDDVLYSYRHALLAVVDGYPVGLCLCYDGRGYHEVRLRTFALLPSKADEMDFEHFEDETGEGEYYIDSLAVMPEFRHRGIAHALMQAQIERGGTLGLAVTLLVDPINAEARRLYDELGFKPLCDVYAFGQTYLKMRI